MKLGKGKKRKPSKNRLDVYAKKHGLIKPDTDADGFIKDKDKRFFVGRTMPVKGKMKLHPAYIVGFAKPKLLGIIVTHSNDRRYSELKPRLEEGDPNKNYVSDNLRKSDARELFVVKRYLNFKREGIDEHADKVIVKIKNKK